MRKSSSLKSSLKELDRTIIVLAFARFADALGNSILIILLPLYIASSPPPNSTWSDAALVSVVVAAYGLINIILQPIFGTVIDRIRFRKPLIMIGLVIMAGGTLAFSFAESYTSLLVIRLVQGIGVSLTVPASLTLISSATVRESRGQAMGFYSTLRLVGFALGPLVGGYLHVNFGFNVSFYVGAGTIFLGLIMVQIWVKETPNHVADSTESRSSFFDRDIWNVSILSLGAAMFVMACAYSMMGTLENEFNARLQQTALGFGIASSALTFSRLLVQTPLGQLSDRIGRKPLIIAGLILMAPATVLLGLAGTTLHLTGARMLQGVTSAAIAAPALAMVGDLSTENNAGRQMSIATTGFFLGIAIGPLIAGYFSSYFFELPFFLVGFLLLLGAMLVYWKVPRIENSLA